MQDTRVGFGSKIGGILAAAGSAVGLGNIWRFPYETGNHGGAAFILVYLGCVLFLGLPIMVAEFSIGRSSKASTGKSFSVLAPGTQWKWVGYLGVLTGFLILGYYSVVAGWTLEYILEAGINGFANNRPEDFVVSFQSFSQNPWKPLFWLIVFLLMTHYIIVKVLAICSITLPNSQKGLEFLFNPDFSKLNSSVFLSALGQAFFSLSLGMGCLSTYASYFGKDAKLGNTAVSVATIDTLVAILGGVIIFPAAFSVGIQPDAGPSLIFITLPNVFQQAFSGIPILAYIFSVSFYVLLALAALTSTISMHEVSTAFLNEKYGMSRGRAAKIVTAGCILIGVISSLSLGVMQDYTLFGKGIFDALDFVTAKIMLPLGGMLISIFVGWYLDKSRVKNEFTNNGSIKLGLFNVYIFILKYVLIMG